MSNYEFSGKEEITLEPEENVIKNANVIVEESRNAEKQVFSIVYDATKKDLLMAELKRLECEVLVQPNSPTSITVRMSMAQLAAIKSLNCIDKVEIMRENVDLGDAVSFTNNIKSESNSNNNAVYSEVGEVDSTNEGVATMSYGGEGECGCNNSNDMQNAITLSLESWTSEYIGCPDAELWYEFTPSTTAYYTIYTNGSLDTIGELYDSEGNFIDRNDDYGTELNFRLVHQLTKNQKYYIKVTTYRNNTGAIGIVVTSQVFVDSIVVAPANVTLEKGKTKTLTATVSPTYATNKSLRWESSNTNVVTVNSSTGKITAVNGGVALVSAYALDGSGKRDCCQVSVTVPVASVTMDTSTRVMHVGTGESFSATVLPQNATDKRLNWASSKPAVAEVDSVTGYVIAKTVGTTNITATAQDGSEKEDVCVLTVEAAIPVQGVTLCGDTYTMKVGQNTSFSYTIHPYDATNQSVTWCSSNPGVAVVNTSTGQITARAPGTTTISVSTNDGSFVDSCTVKVIIDTVIIQKDGNSNKVVFESSGKVWYCINHDTIFDEQYMHDDELDRRSSYNFYAYYDETTPFFDKTRKVFSDDEIRLLYAIDPYGVANYVLRNAKYKDNEGGGKAARLGEKDRVFRILFNREPKYFTRTSEGEWYETTDKNNPYTVQSESESIFGMSPIWDDFTTYTIIDIAMLAVTTAIGGVFNLPKVADFLEAHETFNNIAKVFSFALDVCNSNLLSVIGSNFVDEAFEETSLDWAYKIVSSYSSLTEVVVNLNSCFNYHPQIIDCCANDLYYNVLVELKNGQRYQLNDISELMTNYA